MICLQYVAAETPEPRPHSGTFVAMPATVESPGIKHSLPMSVDHVGIKKEIILSCFSKKLNFAGPRDFEGGNTRRAFVDSMLKAEQVGFNMI